MKKLLYIILLLVSGKSYAQLLQSAPANRQNALDKYELVADSLIKGGLHSGTLVERDLLLSTYPKLLKPYMEFNTPGKKWLLNSTKTVWLDVTGYTSSQVQSKVDSLGAIRSINGFNPAGTINANQSNIAGNYILDSSNTTIRNVPFTSQSVSILATGNGIPATNNSGRGAMLAIDNLTGNAAFRGQGFLGYTPWYTLFHSGNLSFGSGLSYSGGVLSASGGAASTLQTVATAGNSYTGRLSTQGNDGTVYQNFINQTTIPTPTTGQVNFGFVGGSPAWRNPLGQRRFRSGVTGDVDFYLPYYNGSAVQRLASKDSVDVELAKKVNYTDTTAAFANLAHRNTNNTFTGNNLFNGTATFSNNFILSGVSPALTWTTTGNSLSSSWSRSPTLNTFSEQSSVYQPGAVGKSIRLNTDGRTTNYQYGTFANTSLPTGNGTATFSICFWFRTLPNDASNMTLLDLGVSGSYLRLSNGVFQYFGNGTLRSATGVPLLNDGIWHYAVYAKAPGSTATTIYIDNSLVSGTTGNSAGFATGSNSYLGISASLTEPFKGEFDGLLIYNYAIGSTEVSTNWNANAGTASPANQAALLANWPFDEGTGVTAATVNGSTRNITFTNNPTWNPAGKISAVGGTVTATGFSHIDGQVNGEKGQSVVGDVSGASVLRGVAVRSLIDGKNSLSIGRDNNIRLDPTYVFDPDNLGSVSPYARVLIGAGTSTIGQLQWLTSPTLVPSANNIGTQSWYGGRNNIVTDATTVQQYAYTSDLTPARTPLLVTANATMVLNADYLNTTATQYTLTLPTTTGFTTQGNRIITVLVTGTGGVRISVPSGYAMQAGSTFATTTGSGGATLTQGQKVQLIPVGTNSYYLQALNGSITVN